MTEQLKLCPFCGSTAEVKKDEDRPCYSVSCTGCSVKILHCRSKKVAIEAWNRRQKKYEQLKPCPFCGQDDALEILPDDSVSDFNHVECWHCGGRGPSASLEEDAIRAWNNDKRVKTDD